MKSIVQLSFIATVVCMTSCSPTLNYYTESLHDEYRWSESALKNVQFYLSEDIVLYRDLGNEESTIKDGKILIKEGRRIEEIIFPKETAGVLLFSPKEDRFAVSFDDSDDSYLMFGPNKKAGGKFVLLAKDWDRTVGNVTYKGNTYKTRNNSAMAALLVDIDKARKVNKSSERIKGRKL